MWKKVITLSILLAACQETPDRSQLSADQTLETIYGYSIKEQSIDFRVLSTGCTGKANFDLLESKSYPAQWILRRIKPDYCKAAPHVVTVNLPKSAAEGSILNPVQGEDTAVSCSTPVIKPIPGTADFLYLEAGLDISFDSALCDGQGGYSLVGSASRNGGFVGFSDFEAFQTEVCPSAKGLQTERISTGKSEAQLKVLQVGEQGIEKLSLTMDAGKLDGAYYRLSCKPQQ